MVEEFHSNPTCQILLLSYTNRAVDEICDMLESIRPTPPYLRIGNELSCEERFRPHLVKNMTQSCRNRKEIRQFLNEVRIVAGTVSSISGQPELFDRAGSGKSSVHSRSSSRNGCRPPCP